jgi:Tol biopolymer transport system component
MAKRGLLARVGFAVTAVVASAALLTGAASSATASRAPASRAPAGAAKPAPTPVVGANAFSGQGRLAFVSAGKLYVLDGTKTGRPAVLDLVAAPADVLAPAFSADGKWLAFLVTAPSSYPQVSYYTGTLWLARADGTGAHPVLANASTFAWSPTSDVLAVTVYPPNASVVSELYELGPGMSARLVHGASGPAAWSPDGRQIAFASMSGRPPGRFTGLLETMPAAGGTPVVRYRSAQNALDLAGWWPDGADRTGPGGLLAWIDEQSSASLAADGLPLVTVPLSRGPLSRGPLSGEPTTLGTTLVYPAFVSVSHALAAISAGDDRYEWDSKNILVCDLTGGCARLPAGSPGATNTDPALSPDGRYLAFVHGAATSPDDFSQVPVSKWYATRSLWLDTRAGGNGAGGQVRQLTSAGTSVADPTWSADGQRLLYVRGNGLWLLNPAGGGPVRIVASLFSGAWPNYYYYIDWPDQFAWYSKH